MSNEQVYEAQEIGNAMVPMGVAIVKVENETLAALARAEKRKLGDCIALIKEEIDEVPEFAGEYFYDVDVGGGKFAAGVSIDGALLIKRSMKGFVSGFRIVDSNPEYVIVEGYCIDFINLVQEKVQHSVMRKQKSSSYKVKQGADPHYYLEGRNWENKIKGEGSKAERNAILRCIPASAVETTHRHARTKEREYVEGNMKGLIEEVAKAFATIGISTETLGKKLGKDWTLLNADNITMLRSAFRAIKKGEMTIEEWLTPPEQAQETKEQPKPKEAISGAKNLYDEPKSDSPTAPGTPARGTTETGESKPVTPKLTGAVVSKKTEPSKTGSDLPFPQTQE